MNEWFFFYDSEISVHEYSKKKLSIFERIQQPGLSVSFSCWVYRVIYYIYILRFKVKIKWTEIYKEEGNGSRHRRETQTRVVPSPTEVQNKSLRCILLANLNLTYVRNGNYYTRKWPSWNKRFQLLSTNLELEMLLKRCSLLWSKSTCLRRTPARISERFYQFIIYNFQVRGQVFFFRLIFTFRQHGRYKIRNMIQFLLFLL